MYLLRFWHCHGGLVHADESLDQELLGHCSCGLDMQILLLAINSMLWVDAAHATKCCVSGESCCGTVGKN